MSSTSNESAGQLGLWDAISIIVGIVIGTTIYMEPSTIFFFSLDPVWGLSVWVIGGLIALIGAFCYAELATTYPRAGGDYYYLSRGFGPGTGFLFGWAQLTLVMPASVGAMAYAFASYFLDAFYPKQSIVFELPVGDRTYTFDPYFAIAAMVVTALTFTNILGVFVGKTVQNLLTIAKVLGVGGLIIAGLCWYEPGAWEYTPKDASTPYLGSLAIILVMYAYGGWNDAAFVAAEVRDPKRNIPKALFLGVGIIMLVYVLVNAAYINSVGWDNLQTFDSDKDAPVPAQVISGSPLGAEGGFAMCLIVMVSALGAVNGLTFTYARVSATLGAEHRLFGWMGYWRPGHGSPIVALLVQAVLTLLIVAAITTKEGHNTVNEGLDYINTALAEANTVVQKIDENRHIAAIDFRKDWQPGKGFSTLVSRTAPAFWFFFLLTGLSLFLLREKNKNLPRPYSVPFYPVVPIIFCFACAWMLYRATIYIEWHVLFAIAIVLLGVPLYLLSRLISGAPRDAEPPDTGPALPPAPTAPAPARKPWR
jgi:amino acid transporter